MCKCCDDRMPKSGLVLIRSQASCLDKGRPPTGLIYRAKSRKLKGFPVCSSLFPFPDEKQLFPFTKYGVIEALVTQVSDDAVVDEYNTLRFNLRL